MLQVHSLKTANVWTAKMAALLSKKVVIATEKYLPEPFLQLGVMTLLAPLVADSWKRIYPKNEFQKLSAPPREKAPPLRIVRPRRKLMSYNAEHFYASKKGKFVKPAPSMKALAKAILMEDPDVLALQEAGDSKMLQTFNKKYLQGKYPNIVSIPPLDHHPMRVAMMSKADTKVVEAKSHWAEMAKTAPYQGKRDFLETTFQTDTGYQFTVYNAHCKSMRGDEATTAPIRMQEVTNAVKILKERLDKDPTAQIFVTGDFNTLHDSTFGKPVIEKLTHINDKATEPDLTEVMLKDGKSDPTHNGRGHHPNNKLDYTFVSAPMAKQVIKAYVAGKFDKQPWETASDHLPLVTIFEETAPVAKKEEAKKDKENIDPNTASVVPKSRKRKFDMIA